MQRGHVSQKNCAHRLSQILDEVQIEGSLVMVHWRVADLQRSCPWRKSEASLHPSTAYAGPVRESNSLSSVFAFSLSPVPRYASAQNNRGVSHSGADFI